ncbi:MAG TPA: antibiotic biosynthesis monooxygenase [Streptosporangiaceae bacterium]|nr:antibiotic biosynthesis monooxygenase [Streptosporangiaceae bacterium]
MDDGVSWLYELAVKPDQLDNFRTLMVELVDSTRTEPGALGYEWSLSDDGSVAHVSERYADSAATLTHLAKFRETYGQRFHEAVEPSRLVVYGTPSEQVRDALKASSPAYMSAFAGFTR